MTPKADAELLTNDLLPFSKQMLKDYGEFDPYGGYMRADGTIVHVGADLGVDHPRGKEVAAVLREGFHARARVEGLRAVAIVLNVLVVPPGHSEKVDAIEVQLDHVDGYSIGVFFPYAIFDDAGLVVEKPFFSRGQPFAFGKNELPP